MVLTHRDPFSRQSEKGKLVPATKPQALTVLGGLGFVDTANPWESGKMQILIGRSG